MEPILLSTYLLIFAYFFGSFNSAIFVCKTSAFPDPREQGSQNPGATNVLRIAGKRMAAVVLIVDLLKGLLPVLIGHWLQLSSSVLGFVGLFAVLGHMFSVYHKLQGGKGVATSLGVFFGLNPWFGIACCAVWLLCAKFSRYSSLSSMLMVFSAPVIILAFPAYYFNACFPLSLMTFLVLYKHKANIKRLCQGNEPKLGKK